MKYTWDPFERRHQNAVGSVFYALVVKKMAALGVSGVTLWTQKGKAFGSLIDGDDKIFPTYDLYRWGAKYLHGDMAKTSSGGGAKLQIIAVTNGNQKAVLLLTKPITRSFFPPSEYSCPAQKRCEQLTPTVTKQMLR